LIYVIPVFSISNIRQNLAAEALLESRETKVKHIPGGLLEASLVVSFSDIGSQSYSQAFRATLNLGDLMHAATEDGAKFFGTLDFDTK
jgi:hypothetical protein